MTQDAGALLKLAPEVFLFYRNGLLHHILTDRKVFDDWMEKSPWQYPPDRCEIVRYIPDEAASQGSAGGEALEVVRHKMKRLKETECYKSGQMDESLLYGLHGAVERYLTALPRPVSTGGAETIDSAPSCGQENDYRRASDPTVKTGGEDRCAVQSGDDLDERCSKALALCDNDPRATIKALLHTNDMLTDEVGAYAMALGQCRHYTPAQEASDCGDDENRTEKISALIARLQSTLDRWGDTCVYIRRGGLSWGAVALNRQDDDRKHGVFDLQAQHDRDMLERLGQVERLKKDRDEWRQKVWDAEAKASTVPSADGGTAT